MSSFVNVKLDNNTVADCAARYAEAVVLEFDPLQVVLFGSYVQKMCIGVEHTLCYNSAYKLRGEL
jgi:hypothetical protein